MPPDGYYPNFDKDLREGKAREDAFVHVLLRGKVEHKRDHKCVDTGNVAIEYEQRCRDGEVRPSGVSITEAHRYAIEFYAERWLIVPVEDVKRLARRAIKEGRDRWIGDGGNHHNALVPFEWFREAGEEVSLRAVA